VSHHTQIVVVLWFTSMVAIASAAFLCWGAWSLFWDLYDHLMQRHKRIRNNRFDGARRANQFHISACFRDVKGIHR
jgi:hypothetical protein